MRGIVCTEDLLHKIRKRYRKGRLANQLINDRFDLTLF